MTEKIEFRTEKRKISDLIDCSYNPRTLSKKQYKDLKNSFKKFGYVEICAINTDNTIIAGHQRVHVMKDLGWEDQEIEVRVPNRELTKKEFDEYLIRSNQNGGSYDWDLLANDFEFDELCEWGFDKDELLGNMEFEEPEQEEKEEGEIPEPEDNPVTKKGDIWILGNHRVMCGDSKDAEEIKKLCDNKMVDMWLTDPPYNVSYTGKTKDALTIQNDEMDDDSFRKFLRESYISADSVMKAGAVFYIWHADSEGYNFRGAAKDVGWKVRQCLIWNKNCMVMGRQDYHWKHEPCLYGWKEGSHKWKSDRKQTTILDFDRPSRSTEHPTMKPVEIMVYQIKNNTEENDIVLDSFGGSGSTLIACEKTNRNCYMMELDEKYCDVIVKRWQEFTGEEAILEKTGETFNQLFEEKNG